MKELSRLLERASVKTGLDKTGLQQLDRTLSDVARILGGKVSWALAFPSPNALSLSYRLKLTNCVSKNSGECQQ